MAKYLQALHWHSHENTEYIYKWVVFTMKCNESLFPTKSGMKLEERLDIEFIIQPCDSGSWKNPTCTHAS